LIASVKTAISRPASSFMESTAGLNKSRSMNNSDNSRRKGQVPKTKRMRPLLGRSSLATEPGERRGSVLNRRPNDMAFSHQIGHAPCLHRSESRREPTWSAPPKQGAEHVWHILARLPKRQSSV
jgi:hypothetical protein